MYLCFCKIIYSKKDHKSAERERFSPGKTFEGNKEKLNLDARGLFCFIDSLLMNKVLNALRNFLHQNIFLALRHG